MKKLTSLLLAFCLLTSLTACGEENYSESSVDEANPEVSSLEEIPYEPALLKLGMGIVTNADGSMSADETNPGKFKTNTVICAVAVDPDGIIRKVKFDTLRYDFSFDNKGLFTTDTAAPIKTLREMGYDLGMAETSLIKQEWFQQMDSFENYIVGKKITDILNMELDENYIPAAEELKGMMDIGVSDQLSALSKAYSNAV